MTDSRWRYELMAHMQKVQDNMSETEKAWAEWAKKNSTPFGFLTDEQRAAVLKVLDEETK